jgi:acyl-CoA thioester hydrolase
VTAPQSTSVVRVRYSETDQMGIVYYANYMVWFEVARTDLLRLSGWSYREMETDGYALPVIEAHCEYRQSAKYDDEIEIRTRGTWLSPVRVRFDYTVVRASDACVLADGHTVHAALDPAGRPRRLPERVRTLFAEAFTEPL